MSDTAFRQEDLYHIQNWGEGYFDIDQAGNVCVCPFRDESPGIRLSDIMATAHQQGLATPLLLRFPHILHDRITQLQHAFTQARRALQYQGDYICVYPIKVNQQRSVVNTILDHDQAPIGLEAGSKAELMAILGIARSSKSLIICNGYKDHATLRLAFLGQQMGHRVCIIIEQLSEVKRLLEVAKAFHTFPLIGIRVRLSSLGAGPWQNTGGEKSKFGLTSSQVLTVIAELKQANLLKKLQILHFHMGSQIANIKDLQAGLQEGASYYAALINLGVPLNTVDVGGGLSVDYEGMQRESSFSMNYTISAYAREVVQAFKAICTRLDCSEPHIVTEAGRALVAHHAVLVINTIGIEKSMMDAPSQLDSDAPHTLLALQQLYLASTKTDAFDTYQSAVTELNQAECLFNQGALTLVQRALAEQFFQAILRVVSQRLTVDNKTHHSIFTDIEQRFASKYVGNFSLFRSVPDLWGIQDQVFPIMPLNRLTEPLSERAYLYDMTCDSDGRIDAFVSDSGIEKTLRLPCYNPHQPYNLGFFLIGAYQEILGDIHNLFGATPSVNIMFNPKTGGYHLQDHQQGESVSQLLEAVGFERQELVELFETKLDNSALSSGIRTTALSTLHQILDESPYFSDPEGVNNLKE